MQNLGGFTGGTPARQAKPGVQSSFRNTGFFAENPDAGGSYLPHPGYNFITVLVF
jgi:hypothetical protein